MFVGCFSRKGPLESLVWWLGLTGFACANAIWAYRLYYLSAFWRRCNAKCEELAAQKQPNAGTLRRMERIGSLLSVSMAEDRIPDSPSLDDL
jgi:hypothetical protein